MSSKCPVCLQDAELSRDNPGDRGKRVKCSRCGEFLASEDFFSMSNIYDKNRYKVSGYLRNNFEKGKIIDLLSLSIPEILKSLVIPENPIEIIDKILEYISKKAGKFVNLIKITTVNDYPLFYFEKDTELDKYLQLARELEYIEYSSSSSERTIRLRLKGWHRLEEIKKVSSKSNQAFVAMWFDKDMSDIYDNGIKLALEETGYKPFRIDRKEHNNKIDDEIISEIRRSGLLIADFTGQRGGVYFEAGFALGLSIPVIWTCRDTDFDNLHFDTRQYNHIVWRDANDLKSNLEKRIIALSLDRKK